MAVLRFQIYKTLSEILPASVRQTFYALTVRGVIPKTEAAYKKKFNGHTLTGFCHSAPMLQSGSQPMNVS